MYSKICEILAETGKVKSAVMLGGPSSGARCIVSESGEWTEGDKKADWVPFLFGIMETEETKVITVNGQDILVELFLADPRLVLLGGGHVALAVSKIGKMLGFHVTVMDDREEFVSRERFPEADVRICGGYGEIPVLLPVYENTYYVVVTRGHEGDGECIRQLLKRPHRYLGMIGSRRKVALIREQLEREGFSREQLSSVHAPIGLPIGGQTPEEIAVSILAEIIGIKNEGSGAGTDLQAVYAAGEGRQGVMMTIVKKSGSSPRGIGSRIFCDAQGRSFGSIGGGAVEYAAVKQAPLVREPRIFEYDLSGGEKDGTGMICGGRVEVLFEPCGKTARG